MGYYPVCDVNFSFYDHQPGYLTVQLWFSLVDYAYRTGRVRSLVRWQSSRHGSRSVSTFDKPASGPEHLFARFHAQALKRRNLYHSDTGSPSFQTLWSEYPGLMPDQIGRAHV